MPSAHSKPLKTSYSHLKFPINSQFLPISIIIFVTHLRSPITSYESAPEILAKNGAAASSEVGSPFSTTPTFRVAIGTRCHTPFAKYMKELLPSKLEFYSSASIHHTLLVLDYCHCLFIVTLLTCVFLIVLVVPKHPYLLTSLKSHFQVNTSKFQISFKMVSIT